MFLELDDLTPLHEAYACALGRALVVCQHIEDCAHHVMLTWAITDAMGEGTDDHDELRALAMKLKDTSLGGSVRRFSMAEDFSSVHVEVIDAGREARNWLVHHSGAVIGVQTSMNSLLETLREFARQLDPLCEAARLLSVASYEICERERAPANLAESAGSRLKDWIMEPVLRGFGELAGVAPPAV